MKQVSPLPLKVPLDTSLVPTKEEYQECLSLLQHIYEENPEKLVKILSSIHPFVEHRQQNYLQFPQPLKTMLINLYKIPQKRQGTASFFRRVSAKIYCYSGSTYGRLTTYCKQYKLKFKTNEMEFRNTILSIIKEAYRSIEERVIKNFEILHIKVLDQEETKNFEPILYYLQANMSKGACEVFRREIKNLYNLEKREEIELTLCYQFYHQLREKMQARQAELGPQAKLMLEASNKSKQKQKQSEDDVFKPNPAYSNYHYDLTSYKEFPKHHHVREDNPQIWTPLVQHELVALFLQLRDLAKVRLQLQDKYGEHPQLTCIGKLKCKLIKIIRGSIRLLQGFYRQRCNDVAPPLPKMIDIDEDKVKLLIGSPYQIKACILQFFRQTTMSYFTLCEVIKEINVFIMEKSFVRYQKSTASKAIIFSL